MGSEKSRSVWSSLEREGWDGAEVRVEYMVQEEVVAGWLAYLYALRWERIELAKIHVKNKEEIKTFFDKYKQRSWIPSRLALQEMFRSVFQMESWIYS